MLQLTVVLSWVVSGGYHSCIVLVDDGWELLLLSEVSESCTNVENFLDGIRECVQLGFCG